MSQPSARTSTTQRFVLRAEQPFRALAIAAVTAVVGAVLLVLWRSLVLPLVVPVIGAVLLALAMAVTVAAALADRRWRQTVTLDEQAVTVADRRSTRTVTWSDIKQLKLDGDQLVLVTGTPEQAAEVRNPHGPSERAFAALLQAMSARLDADRGYHSME